MEARKGSVNVIYMLILVLGLAAGISGAQWFYRARELAQWKKDYAVLEDSAKKWKARTTAQGAKVDTVLKTVRLTANRPVFLTDTVEVPVRELVKDTAWAMGMVRDAFTLRRQCLELTTECETFKRLAAGRFANYEEQIQKLKDRPERSCAMWFVAGSAVGSGGTLAIQGAFR